MIFDGRPTSEITPDEIEALVREHVEEDEFLDYKARPYSRDDHGIHELVKDVCAFANAQGGYLIIGIGEEGGNARHANGFVNVEDAEGERRRMIDHCIEKIEPRLPQLDIRAITVGENNVLVCHVLESAQKPHCARPDREHHYFWRRYEDGNRLMTVPEIRECLEGDRTLRELTELIRQLAGMRRQDVVTRETEQEVNDANVFQLETIEAFRRYTDQQFQDATQDRPYYRLTATPLPVNSLSLRDRLPDIERVLETPPQLRSGGWDSSVLSSASAPRITATGVMRQDLKYKHLRVLWNGHAEFWTQVDDRFFRLSGDVPPGTEVEHQFIYPCGVSEFLANFVLLMRELCRIVEFDGEIEFGLGFYRIRGLYLAPGDPESWGYMRARSDAGRDYGPQPFGEDDLVVPSVRATVGDLPSQMVWRLVSRVYYRFGYQDAQIPFFDGEHNFTLGAPQQT